MKTINWTQQELDSIALNGCICVAVAHEAMKRSGLNFDDIEMINQHYETHTWGSNTDRKYRKAALNKAVLKVAKNPLDYIN